MSVNDDDDFWADILAYIRQQELVTITGPDLSVVSTDDGEQSLTKLIGQRLAEEHDLDLPPGGATMGEAVAAILRKPGGIDRVNRLYPAIHQIIDDLDPQPGDPLRDLAAITDLRLFVNTTPDQLLLQALNAGHSPERPSTREVTYSPNLSSAEHSQNQQPAAATDTVVLNLLGRATAKPQYVIHEEDHLEFLHALLSNRASLPEWLDEKLREQPMLFIGCDIPDWVGRFFLRMSKKDRLLSHGEKRFYIVGSSDSHEPALSRFFETYCRKPQVQYLDMAPDEFVAELRARWEKVNLAKRRPAPGLSSPTSAPTLDAPTIFISYMREDVVAARRLRDAIVELGGDVWLDERRLLPGDTWEAEIKSAIRRTVRLFVAVASANTEHEDEGYVFKEWRAAKDRSDSIQSRRFIVPVIIDDDYRGDPSGYSNLQKMFENLNFGCAPAGNPDENLLKMLTEEIRAMRRGGAK
jgi:TIR domain/SIR2-like domain